jgi:hypothetical protein
LTQRPGWLWPLTVPGRQPRKTVGRPFQPANQRGVFNPQSQSFVLHREFTHHPAGVRIAHYFGSDAAPLAGRPSTSGAIQLGNGQQGVLIGIHNFLKSNLPFVFAEPSMDPSKSEMAFRHVMDGRRIVARQRERVETLARNGRDTTEAKRTLDLFARTLNIFEDDLRQILADEWKKATIRCG